ncbi:MAG TPA: RNA polymerase sigma factor FliA [Burkholderiales bacterium]
MHAATAAQSTQHWVKQYAPLVRRIANHIMARMPASVEMDDIIQAGMIGLMDAYSRYEETQGARFETYASQRIRGAMLDELRKCDWLPRAIRRNMRAIEKAMQTLEQKLGRPPSEQEVAGELGMPLADYQQMLQDARGHQLVYYEDYAGDDQEHFLDRHAEHSHKSSLENRVEEDMCERLVAAIENLPEREKLMMDLYYEQYLNLAEIGEVLGVSQSRVCQLHTQAVSRLREKLRDS